MYNKNKKHLHHKLAASMLAATMIFSAVGAPTFAMGSEPIALQAEQAKQGSFSFYDIDKYGSTDLNLDQSDPTLKERECLMKKTLLGKSSENGKSVLENWAVLACGMFADIPSSYSSEDQEDDFGQYKHLSDFKARFTNDVQNGKDYYGNLYKLLTSTKGKWQSTNDSIYSAKYHQDINTSSTGLKYAANLNDVQTAAFQQLSDLDGGEHLSAQDYKNQHEIQAMSDTKGKDSPALYSIVATRDKYGILSNYHYTALGIAFYDFKVEEVPEDSGFVTSIPLTPEQQKIITEKMLAGENVDLNGFSYSKTPESSKADYEVNDSSSPMSATHALTKTTTTTLTDTNTVAHAFKQAHELSASYKVQCPNTILSFMFSGELAGGYKLTKDQTDTFTDTHTVTNTETETKTDTHGYTIPAYSASELEINTTSKKFDEKYNKPVCITYKVAVFSMTGGHSGRDFEGDGWSQRSFFAEIGSDLSQSAAWSNLKNRTSPSHISDYTYGKSTALTRLTGKLYQRGFWPWTTKTRRSFDWDNPYVDSVRWDEVIHKANLMGIDGSDETTGQKAVDALTTQLPVSMTEGSFIADTSYMEINHKGFVATRPLYRVSLENSAQASHTITGGSSLSLGSIGLKGKNAVGADFVGFNPELGEWVPADENGNILENCELGTVTKDASGNPIFKAAPGQNGTVYLKYVVKDNVYRVYHQPNVKSADVITPVISVKVQSDSESFVGSIEIPEKINVTYTPGEPVDLNNLKGLNVDVFDAKGHFIDKPVVWTARRSAGMTLTDGKMNFTEDGDYIVRAEYGDVFSNFMTVHAVAAEQPAVEENTLDQDASLAQTAAVLTTLNRENCPTADTMSAWFQENVTETTADQGFEWASQNHVFDEIERASVSKDDAVTKKEFAVMLYKTYGSKLTTEENTDLTKAALDWASEQGMDVSKADENVKLEDVLGMIAHCVNLD